MQQQPTSQLYLNNSNRQQQQQHNHKSHTGRLSQISMESRNRRYMKLKQLHENDFFSQQAIKLRHPLLYYLYVGQYEVEQSSTNAYKNNYENINNSHENNNNDNKDNNSTSSHNNTNNNTAFFLSTFLSKNLLNLQYKQLLKLQLNEEIQNIIEIEKNHNEEQIAQIKRLFDEQKNNFRNYGKDNRNNIRNMVNGEEITEMEEEEDEEYMRKQQYRQQYRQQQYGQQLYNEYQKQVIKKSQFLKHYLPQQHQITKLRESIPSPHNFATFNITIPRNCSSQYLNNKLTEQSICLQQQHLVQHCQQLFLSGRLSHLFDYALQIDGNQKYDDVRIYENDEEERYFEEINEEMDEGCEGYYTGVIDY